MPDKDDFTFDDNDDFSATDLSSAFEESEQQAPPEPPEGKKPSAAKGSSRSRTMLLILLLVVAAGAGAYYFMGLGETTPEVVKTPPPVKKTVALPPKPAQAPAPEPVKTPETPEQKPEVAKLAVPPPPPAEPAKVEQPATAVPEKPAAEKAVAKVEPPPALPKPEVAETAPSVKAVDQKPAVATAPVTAEKPVQAPAPATDAAATSGNYTLDAGSFLLVNNRKTLEKKIRALGYEPRISSVEAQVKMNRLRLGSFPPDQAKEALAYAKTISPSSFSLPEGNHYVVYAGTFMKQQNVDKLREQFLIEGIQADIEPVEVTRNLSRVQFGFFADRQEATLAASQAADAGVTTTVVRSE